MRKPNPISDYCACTGESIGKIEAATGVHRRTLMRARDEGVVPAAPAMQKIIDGLGGAILPIDFFEIPQDVLTRRAERILKEARHA